MTPWRRHCWLFAILGCGILVYGSLVCGSVLRAQTGEQTGDLLTRIWAGAQQAQAKFATACGTMSETRTSKLMVKPMVLRGKFCAEGTNRFMLEYFEPNPMQIRVNENYLNVTADGGKTQVMDIGGDIRRAESTFATKGSLESLEKDFAVTAQENSLDYEVKLVPQSPTYKRKLNYLVVKLNKRDFLPRSVEIDGKSGVDSVFTFDITSVNKKLPEDTFEVDKKKVNK